MSAIEEDIASTPAIARQTIDRVDEQGRVVAEVLRGPVVFLGSGSSYRIGVAAASLYEAERGQPAQSLLGSEYLPRPSWTHVAISRTGKTTELVDAMRRARDAGASCILIGGEPGSPAEEQADVVLALEFAPETSVVQTRFISAAVLALRLLIGGESSRRSLQDLPERLERGLAEFEPEQFIPFEHVVFLGRGWRHGLALAAALNLQETALMVPEAHQTLDYRHGPIASAEEGTLVWCFDPQDDRESAAVLEDVRRTGATVRSSSEDPQVMLAQAQLLAARKAVSRGIDPEAPRHLTRAIVLPGAEG